MFHFFDLLLYSLVNSSKKNSTEEKPPYSYVALIAMAIEVCCSEKRAHFVHVSLFKLYHLHVFASKCCIKHSQQFQDRTNFDDMKFLSTFYNSLLFVFFLDLHTLKFVEKKSVLTVRFENSVIGKLKVNVQFLYTSNRIHLNDGPH